MVNEPVHVVLTLANLMEADGTLNAETAARVDLATRTFMDKKADWLMLIGWDYRPDSELAICDAMAAYAVSEKGIEKGRLLLNRISRDTVGDAIFSRMDIERRFPDFQMTVVTTDYHVPRVNEIFGRVYGPSREVTAIGSFSGLNEVKSPTENDSLIAFEKTFEGVEDGDLAAFRDRMLAQHPFYNGTCFPDRPVPLHSGQGIHPTG
ncbi:MAG: YdcF family protein [Pseudomonadota bacterium]